MSSQFDDLPPAPLDRSARSASAIPRTLSILLGVAALFLIVQGIQPVRSTLAASFMALNLVIVVAPIQYHLAKHIPRSLASVVAGFSAVAILGVLVYVVGWTLARLIQELPRYSSEFNHMVDQVMRFATEHNIDTNKVINQALQQFQGLNVSTIVSTLTSILSGLTNFVTLFVTVLMILVFMVIDSVGFGDRMTRLAQRHNPTLAWGLSSFARGTRKYWVVTTIFGLIVATCNWILLLSLGVPLAIVWGIMSFVTNYIPNIGFFIGIIPPVLMALLANDIWVAMWVIIGYVFFNTVLQTFIQPKFTGDAVGITPTVAIISLLIWAYVLGALGTILAIPATLFVKTMMIDIDPRTRWLNVLIASNPTTSDQDPIWFSNFMKRSKRIRKLTARVQDPGATEAEIAAANRELAQLEEETRKDSHPAGGSSR
jgi:predicted PurR-regulated permease PerM